MKIYERKASKPWEPGQVGDYKSLQDCIDAIFATEDFGIFGPAVIVEKADEMTKDRCGEKCEYIVTIYDGWIE